MSIFDLFIAMPATNHHEPNGWMQRLLVEFNELREKGSARAEETKCIKTPAGGGLHLRGNVLAEEAKESSRPRIGPKKRNERETPGPILKPPLEVEASLLESTGRKPRPQPQQGMGSRQTLKAASASSRQAPRATRETLKTCVKVKEEHGRCDDYVEDSAEEEEGLSMKFKKEQREDGDRLLTVGGKPSKRHSHRYDYDEDEELNEEGVSIYERLLKHLLLLDAEPQIGKTGAALSFLGALEEWIFNNQTKKDSVTNDAGKMEQCALLSRLTKEAHFRCSGGAPCWPMSDDYERYHICLEQERMRSWKLTDPTTFIAQQLSQHIKVADCGCGSGFLFRQLSQLNSRTTVHGYDVDPSILLLAQGPPSRTQFVPHVGDMLDNLLLDTPFSAVVFSLSFFLNDITNHVRTAWHALRSESEDNNAGELFIANVAVRFPKDFVACVESHGFTKIQEQRLGQFVVLRFQKEGKRGEKKLVRLLDPA